MSPATFNEVLQWMALGVLLLLTLALYRQLGLIVSGARQFQTDAFGPRIGAKASRKLRAAIDPAAWRRWNVVAFVQESCSTCEEFLARLREREVLGRDDVTVALLAGGQDEFVAALAREVPEAAVRPVTSVLGPQATLGGQEVTGYPFVFLLDADGVVRFKVLGADADGLVDEIEASYASS